ncbi:hypothetical protein FHX42_003677 [Saccharopolyspora lacisalsi]|uniref:Uncharacterized protein n=1 Tax=Halosaccharopolyspora lacisalsi TaxID=1000566 RepID=A0A839E4P3_9PSEU|nr:hypothetical protein [Halosaccharopolyspora lacisalsi]MBA8826301.1 hypothetical protein [Halosaccharopolyspora lacisalsi]
MNSRFLARKSLAASEERGGTVPLWSIPDSSTTGPTPRGAGSVGGELPGTTGAVALLEAATRHWIHGKHLRVISSPAVERLLGLIEVSDRFTYAGSVDEVVTATPESGRIGRLPTVEHLRAETTPRPRQPPD